MVKNILVPLGFLTTSVQSLACSPLDHVVCRPGVRSPSQCRFRDPRFIYFTVVPALLESGAGNPLLHPSLRVPPRRTPFSPLSWPPLTLVCPLLPCVSPLAAAGGRWAAVEALRRPPCRPDGIVGVDSAQPRTRVHALPHAVDARRHAAAAVGVWGHRIWEAVFQGFCPPQRRLQGLARRRTERASGAGGTRGGGV